LTASPIALFRDDAQEEVKWDRLLERPKHDGRRRTEFAGREHDYGNGSCPRVGQFIQTLEPVHDRHHEIEQDDEGKYAVANRLERLLTIRGFGTA
jgi:hypothetical protein